MELKNPVKRIKYFPLTYSSKDLYIHLKKLLKTIQQRKQTKLLGRLQMTWRDGFFRNTQRSDECVGRWSAPVIRVMPRGDTLHACQSRTDVPKRKTEAEPTAGWTATPEGSFGCYWKEYKAVQPAWKPVLQLLLTLNVWLLCCRCWVTKLCQTLRDLMHCNSPALPVPHYLPELAQTHVHWVSNAIQPSHALSSPSPFFDLSQHQGPF